MAIDLEETFEGLDEAQVMERLPKFPPSGRFVVALRDLEIIQADKGGKTLIIAGKIAESSDPTVKVGQTYGQFLSGLDKHKKKAMQFGRIKQLLGALHNVAPDSAQKWLQILSMIIKNPEKRAGWLFVLETSAEQEKTENGNTYRFTPVNFSAAPAGHEAMPAAQAKLFA